MNLGIILQIAGLVALLISTGIITVGTSTFIANVAGKAFERSGPDSPIGREYTHKGERSLKLQDSLRSFPTYMTKAYFTCHFPTFLLIAFIVLYDAFAEYKISGLYVYIYEYPLGLETLLRALPAFSVFMILFYLCFLMYNLLKFKRELFIIVCSRFE